MMNAEKLQYIVSVDVYKNRAQLPAEEQQLLAEAEKAMAQAYAPYSNFKVGAAILLDNGKIISGNNQENAAYPSGLCAERVALFYAGAHYPATSVKTIAITCSSDADKPVSPCGSCRQVMAEYEQLHKRKIRIIMANQNQKIYAAHGIETLLPFMFGSKDLK